MEKKGNKISGKREDRKVGKKGNYIVPFILMG